MLKKAPTLGTRPTKRTQMTHMVYANLPQCVNLFPPTGTPASHTESSVLPQQGHIKPTTGIQINHIRYTYADIKHWYSALYKQPKKIKDKLLKH